MERICQSCAMPLAQDPMGGGTEADGSVSQDYCSFCYDRGAFRDEGVTLPEFVAKLKVIMGEMHMTEDVVAPTVDILPTLKRWRQTA